MRSDLINQNMVRNTCIAILIIAIVMSGVWIITRNDETSTPAVEASTDRKEEKSLFAVFSGEKYFWFASPSKGKVSLSERDDSFSSDRLDIINLSGYRGTLSGTDNSDNRQEADFIPFPSVVIGNRASNYSPLISDITSAKSYSDEIASELNDFGLSDKNPEIKGSILADMDGDGKEEAFIRISGRSDKRSKEKIAPLYDLLFMVRGSDRSIHGIDINESGVPETSLSHDIAAITDVDNDGEAELLISYAAEKCSGAAVFDFAYGTPTLAIKKISCD